MAVVGPIAPRPARDTRPSVVLAGGCYWGVESVYRHVQGVLAATSGFATPSRGSGGPVEAVRITYDPSRISYRQLLDVFFSVAHDPTQLNRQGPDVGPEYRSMVFVAGDAERSLVRTYIDSLTNARAFPRPIVTDIAVLLSFRLVEESEQDYAAKHPTSPYIVANDAPKLEALKRKFPRLYHD